MVETLYTAMPNVLSHLKPGKPWTDTEWVTVGGNGWVGCGSGGATGGIGANLVIMDDVTGSAARARSEAWGNHAWEWLEEDWLNQAPQDERDAYYAKLEEVKGSESAGQR